MTGTDRDDLRAENEQLRGLLAEAGEVIARMHKILPDDGREHGTAPSWWALGTWANGVRAAIANAVKNDQ